MFDTALRFEEKEVQEPIQVSVKIKLLKEIIISDFKIFHEINISTTINFNNYFIQTNKRFTKKTSMRISMASVKPKYI